MALKRANADDVHLLRMKKLEDIVHREIFAGDKAGGVRQIARRIE